VDEVDGWVAAPVAGEPNATGEADVDAFGIDDGLLKELPDVVPSDGLSLAADLLDAKAAGWRVLAVLPPFHGGRLVGASFSFDEVSESLDEEAMLAEVAVVRLLEGWPNETAEVFLDRLFDVVPF